MWTWVATGGTGGFNFPKVTSSAAPFVEWGLCWLLSLCDFYTVISAWSPSPTLVQLSKRREAPVGLAARALVQLVQSRDQALHFQQAPRWCCRFRGCGLRSKHVTRRGPQRLVLADGGRPGHSFAVSILQEGPCSLVHSLEGGRQSFLSEDGLCRAGVIGLMPLGLASGGRVQRCWPLEVACVRPPQGRPAEVSG